MKMKIVIALFILFAQWHDLNAMAQYQETVKRLGDQMSADSKEHQEARPTLATMPAEKAADMIAQAALKAINQREQEEQKNKIFAEKFIAATDKIWLARNREAKIKTLTNQEAIDKYFIDAYIRLYKEIYRVHYDRQASEEQAQNGASLMYNHQKSAGCCYPCTIL